SMKEYGVRYPGDEYVDILGFDMYDIKPEDNGIFMQNLKKELSIVESFAKQHGKLVAVTETGAANDPAPGDNQTALTKTGNGNKDWYNQVLDIVSASDASYFLLWANFSKKDGFYTPYVDAVNPDGSLHGHEMLDHFISFYNDNRSIFAANQKDVLTSDALGKITSRTDTFRVQGYLTTPLPASRILKSTDIKAKITLPDTKNVTKLKLLAVAKTEKGKVKLTLKSDGKGMYAAKITAKQLETLGKNVGTLALYIDGRRVQRYSVIYNIKAPKEDPYLIDGFENYYGIDDQLAGAWTVNADTGCKVTLSLSKDKKSDGNYGLKFTYDETDTGWGGATISKEVDWSDCNALQFYMVPDGKNQKTVIQINANGVTYEAYLQEYEAYRKNGSQPVMVTIPFSEFCQRDTEGNPKGGLAADSAKIQSFGLWVNAVAGSDAVIDKKVSGTLYYDSITAVKSSVEEFTLTAVK
ncbi:MAG: endoglucanase, partial [Eubacterium sp.]|nr:endoglucanase [Eubacterium sp.]